MLKLIRTPALVLLIGGLLPACTTTAKKPVDSSLPAQTPKLLKPLVKKIWIPPEIRNGGTEWVEGHFLYRIEQEPTWSR